MPAGTPLRLSIDVNGRQFGPMEVPPDWGVVAIPTPAEAWHTGVNRLTLKIELRASPGVEGQLPGVSIDFVRVMKISN